VGDRGGSPTGSFGPALAPGKGKQARVILDDDNVSSDEDEPLQKRLHQLSNVGTATLDEVAVMTTATDKEAVVKRTTAKRAAVKATTDEEVAGKAADEVAGAVGTRRPSTRHPQWPGPRGRWLQVALPHQPNVPTGVFGNLSLSSFLSSLFLKRGFIL
jgi:hypothetical protein